MRRKIIGAGLFGLAVLGGTSAPKAQVALTPPMGWNSWNTFGGNITETLIKSMADSMVSKGLRDAGYVYLNLDDNWFAVPARDAQGNLRSDPTRFPSGIKSLSDYIHSKGLRLGIYGDRGSQTCMTNSTGSGSNGNEERDAKTFASWGIDYLKYDNCNSQGGTIRADYTNMSKALLASGRPIVFSICAWHTEDWMPLTGNLWRSTADITATWEDQGRTDGWSVLKNFDLSVNNFIFTRPGAWADPDMLEVGNGRLTEDENRAHFGLWALAAAPLITGNDISKMNKTVQSILTDKEVIAIDQDSAGIQGRRIKKDGTSETWAKPLGYRYDTFAVGLFNRANSPATITVNWKDLRLEPSSVTVRDLWGKKDLGTIKDGYSAQVPAHGLVLLKAQGQLDRTASFWVSDLHFTQMENAARFLKVDSSSGGKVMKLGGKTYSKGLGTNAPSRVIISLKKMFNRFQSDVGIDDGVSGGSVVFQVMGDGKKLFESPVLKGGGTPAPIDVSVEGIDSLTLVVTDGGDGGANDQADWAGAKLIPSTTTALSPMARLQAKTQARMQGRTLVLSRSQSSPAWLRLFDARGRIVMERQVEGTNASFALTRIPRGSYSIRLSDSPKANCKVFVLD